MSGKDPLIFIKHILNAISDIEESTVIYPKKNLNKIKTLKTLQ